MTRSGYPPQGLRPLTDASITWTEVQARDSACPVRPRPGIEVLTSASVDQCRRWRRGVVVDREADDVHARSTPAFLGSRLLPPDRRRRFPLRSVSKMTGVTRAARRSSATFSASANRVFAPFFASLAIRAPTATASRDRAECRGRWQESTAVRTPAVQRRPRGNALGSQAGKRALCNVDPPLRPIRWQHAAGRSR